MQSEQVEIERRDRVTHGEYLAHVPGSDATGKLTWTLRGDVRHAEHTLVPHHLRGRGIAGVLVDALVADARREGFRIAPDCSYVASKFAEHPEWADLKA